jgi:predicted DNA-binding WGR domain protein
MLIMHRRDADKSMNRFYALAVHPDLIDGWTLLREWGRVGSPGRVVVEPFEDEAKAEKAGARIEIAKQRRGYRKLIRDQSPLWPTRNPDDRIS